ncbi:MAG: HEPN domain-containing protein [Magnetococcales bacterium]|nr:HEPN domain-containing protein [Magnetococcales bacterium]
MSGHDHARSLLALACDDLKASRVMAPDVDNFSDAIFGFLVQQTIEKLLKAWLSFLDVEYPKTHELHRLLILLEKQGAVVNHFYWVEEFNPFAVQFRYESSLWGEPLDRTLAIAQVDELLDHVRRQLEPLSSRERS